MYLMGGKAFLFGLRVVRRVPNGVGEMVVGFQSRRLKDHIFSHIQETEQNGQRVAYMLSNPTSNDVLPLAMPYLPRPTTQHQLGAKCSNT